VLKASPLLNALATWTKPPPRGGGFSLQGSCNPETRYKSDCKLRARYKFKTLWYKLKTLWY